VHGILYFTCICKLIQYAIIIRKLSAYSRLAFITNIFNSICDIQTHTIEAEQDLQTIKSALIITFKVYFKLEKNKLLIHYDMRATFVTSETTLHKLNLS